MDNFHEWLQANHPEYLDEGFGDWARSNVVAPAAMALGAGFMGGKPSTAHAGSPPPAQVQKQDQPQSYEYSRRTASLMNLGKELTEAPAEDVSQLKYDLGQLIGMKPERMLEKMDKIDEFITHLHAKVNSGKNYTAIKDDVLKAMKKLESIENLLYKHRAPVKILRKFQDLERSMGGVWDVLDVQAEGKERSLPKSRQIQNIINKYKS